VLTSGKKKNNHDFVQVLEHFKKQAKRLSTEMQGIIDGEVIKRILTQKRMSH